MGFDIFGLRIALYFPEQRQKVFEMFDNKETAIFERKALESMNNGDVMYDCVNDRDGNDAKIFWSPRGRADANGNATDYRSVVERRFRGYTEEIRYVSFKSKRHELPKPFCDLWVEIQVRSVIMDAYTNISHGLEYKALTGVLSDEEIQVLESTNGLAQTGEVLLQHLQHIHQQRLQSDLKPLDCTGTIAEVARYMDLEASNYPFSRNWYYQRTFYVLLSQIGYNRPGRLKKLLEFYKIKEEYPSKFLEFSASFLGKGSLEAWIFHKILQRITEPQIEFFFASSQWCFYPQSFSVYISTVLFSVCQGDTLDCLDREATEALFHGLETLLFIFIWSSRSREILEGSKLLKAVSRIIGVLDNNAPFLVTHLVGVLFEVFDFDQVPKSFHYNIFSVSSLLVHLAKRPRGLGRGLKIFLDHSERIIEATGMSSEGTGRPDIENKMTQFMLNALGFPDLVEIAHGNPDNIFLDTMAEYMSLRGLDELRRDKEAKLQPWMEYQPSKWRPLSAPHRPELWTQQIDDDITFLSVDFTKIDEKNYYPLEMPKLSSPLQPLIDIIAVKPFDRYRQESVVEKWIENNISHDYIVAKGSFDVSRTLFDHPLKIRLRLCVGKSRFRLPDKANTLRELGPVWIEKSLSDTKNMRAIACDLFVRSNLTSDFIRLRIPNVYEIEEKDDESVIDKSVIDESVLPVCSPSIVDTASASERMEKLLPSSTQWIIFKDERRDDGGAIDQSYDSAELRELPPEVLLHGIRGEAGGEEDAAAKSPYDKYFLKFRLRRPDKAVDPDKNTVTDSRLDSSWGDSDRKSASGT